MTLYGSLRRGEGSVKPWIPHRELGRNTGVVIPAYFSAKPSDELVRHLLWVTLADSPHYLPLGHVYVVVDGDARTARLAGEIQEALEREWGERFALLALPRNLGKFGAMREGICALLADRPEVEWIVIRDGDGDHVLSAMPHLVRAAAFLRQIYGHSRLLVIGSRPNRHRPMGFARGELERLLDAVTVDALSYALARQGRAPDLSYCLDTEAPDLSSGYKVYGREIAEHLFLHGVPHYMTLSEADYWHYGPETVTIVEAVLEGAIVAEVPRPTWDGQPTTSFGEFRLLSLYGELMAWVWARLEIPLEVAASHFDRHTPAMLLRTTGEGRDLLEKLRAYALEKVWRHRGAIGAIPLPKPLLPFI